MLKNNCYIIVSSLISGNVLMLLFLLAKRQFTTFLFVFFSLDSNQGFFHDASYILASWYGSDIYGRAVKNKTFHFPSIHFIKSSVFLSPRKLFCFKLRKRQLSL